MSIHHLNLVSNKNYLYYFLSRYKLSYNDYDDFIHKYEFTGAFKEFDVKPYMFTLSLQTKRDIKAFTIFLTSYLIKSGMMCNSCNLEDIMNLDDEYMLACIIAMQYYFL